MLKKRLIGIIPVKQGIAVQSFGYRKWLPLGSPEVLAKNLDRWGVDEIIISSIDSSSRQLGPDFDLLERIGRIGLRTPLVYGGGISNLEQALKLIKYGADRVVLDSLLFSEPSEVRRISSVLGAQALIAALPLSMENEKIQWLNHKTQGLRDPRDVIPVIDCISEVLIIDWKNEGGIDCFNESLLNNFPISNIPLILFGGVTSSVQQKRLLNNSRVSGIVVGNCLNYSEHKVQDIRLKIGSEILRPAKFQRNQ